MIPKECRIGDTCFTSLATIGGNLYTRNPNNINHVHRDSNNLLSVIIIGSGRYVGGWVRGVGGGTCGERHNLGDDGGGNIGSVMVIANGDALGVTTGVAVGHNLE